MLFEFETACINLSKVSAVTRHSQELPLTEDEDTTSTCYMISIFVNSSPTPIVICYDDSNERDSAYTLLVDALKEFAFNLHIGK